MSCRTICWGGDGQPPSNSWVEAASLIFVTCLRRDTTLSSADQRTKSSTGFQPRSLKIYVKNKKQFNTSYCSSIVALCYTTKSLSKIGFKFCMEFKEKQVGFRSKLRDPCFAPPPSDDTQVVFLSSYDTRREIWGCVWYNNRVKYSFSVPWLECCMPYRLFILIRSINENHKGWGVFVGFATSLKRKWNPYSEQCIRWENYLQSEERLLRQFIYLGEKKYVYNKEALVGFACVPWAQQPPLMDEREQAPTDKACFSPSADPRPVYSKTGGKLGNITLPLDTTAIHNPDRQTMSATCVRDVGVHSKAD